MVIVFDSKTNIHVEDDRDARHAKTNQIRTIENSRSSLVEKCSDETTNQFL